MDKKNLSEDKACTIFGKNGPRQIQRPSLYQCKSSKVQTKWKENPIAYYRKEQNIKYYLENINNILTELQKCSFSDVHMDGFI